MATNNVWNSTLPAGVASGGTGASSLTAHGVLIGEGTSAVAATTAGTDGQVLVGKTSNDPSFITPTAGTGLSLTANSTTLSYALSTPVAIANGGTNATSMSTSTGIVKYDGTSLITSTAALIDSSNRYTNTSQPAFAAYNNVDQTSVTGDGTVYTVLYNTSLFDQNSNFSSPTFTAPIAGKYRFTGTIAIYNIGAQTYLIVKIVTTTQTVIVARQSLANSAFNALALSFGTFLPMSATNTCTITLEIGGSTKTINIDSANTLFHGELVC